MTLTQEQQTALDAVLLGIRDGDRMQTIGGLAGTGKSTLLAEMIRQVDGTIVMAYTGKAASVLRRKGVDAQTIHSSIYERRGKGMSKRFVRRRYLDGRVIVIDEGSMVGKFILDDLQAFKLPIVVFGDHGQLPPIGEDAGLMLKPNYRLETIHRNAGPIALFALHLRNGGRAQDFKDGGEAVEVLDAKKIGPDEKKRLMLEADQIICGYNAQRVAVNKAMRKLLGHELEDGPEPGDRVMCLKNKRDLGIFNGMQGTVGSFWHNGMYFYPPDHDGVTIRPVPRFWNNPKPEPVEHRDPRVPFDFSYCVTAHKFQGDEADSVLVLSSVWREEETNRRWNYTAASRAKEKLTWIIQ